MGCYPSWRAYSAYTPDLLDGSKLTVVNYAFADVGRELRLIVSDPAVDPCLTTHDMACNNKLN